MDCGVARVHNPCGEGLPLRGLRCGRYVIDRESHRHNVFLDVSPRSHGL